MAILNLNSGNAYTDIHAAVAAATAGDTLILGNGTYSLGASTLNIDKTLTITGASEAGVIIDASGVDGYGIFITGDGSSLSKFTLNGPAAGSPSGNYGLKAGPDTGDPGDTLNGLDISHVTVSNSGRAEFDLNGVVNATLSDVTADGNGTAGHGIALTDCANITLNNIETIDNAWGSVALYPTNRYYEQQLTGVTFTGTYTANETIKVYLEDASNGISGDGSNEVNGVSTNLGTLTLPASFANNHGWQVQFTPNSDTPTIAYFASEADADNFLGTLSPAQLGAAALENPDGDLVVKPGLSLQAAIDASADGDTILVFPGEYTEHANYNPANNTNDPAFTNPLGLLVNHSVTIQGVTAAGVPITDAGATEATVISSVQSNWGTNFHVTAADVTIAGLTLKGVGSAGQPYVNKAIEVIAGGFTLENSVVTAVDNIPIYSAVYINDEDTTGADPNTFVSSIDSYTITGNDLYSSLVVTNGAGHNVPFFAGVITSNNTFLNTPWVDPVNNDDVNWPLLLTGTVSGTPWQNAPVATPTEVSGNVVDLGSDTQILLRLRDEDPARVAGVDFVEGFTDNNDIGPYAYVLNPLGELRLIQMPGQTASTFYMVANVAGVMSFDNAYPYGDAVPLAEAGDTVVVYSGAATQNADVTIDNLGFLVKQGSADLNLTLAAGVVTLTALDYAAGLGANVDITGNALGNTITGNSGDNVLAGDAGADALSGGAGNDLLDGGTDIDVLRGGAGNDTYIVDDAADKTLEAAGAGTADRVKTSVSFALGSRAEIEFLETSNAAGTDAINLTGSTINNRLTGNAGSNVLDGAAGNDLLIGNAGDDFLQGAAGNDLLLGGAGADTLDGGTGFNRLTGGGDLDVFLFNDTLGATTKGQITDFDVVMDLIHLDNAIFNKLVGAENTALSDAQFYIGAAAHDLDDRILYNSASGALLYDADGNKVGGVAAVTFATVTPGLALTHDDFIIV